MHRNLAVASDRQLTTSHGPRDEALRNSATPTGGSGRRIQIGDGKSEIRNSKFEILNQMPPPFSNRSVLGLDCEIFAPDGTSRVNQTLPPMTAPLPIVTRPRMVAPE